MTSECSNLDAYLANGLPAGAATQFAQHIDQCELCHEAVEQQRWIDHLLRSEEIAPLEPIPPALRLTLHTSIRRHHQTARLIACGLAAAAAVAFVAVGWTLFLNHHTNRIAEHVEPAILQKDPIPTNTMSSPRATFVSNGDTIAVPLESTDDDVSIVQLYPTTETVRRTRNKLALELLYSESNGG